MTATLDQLVARAAQRRPEAVAVVDGERRLTYGDLERQANRLAHALIEAGCHPGDRVGIVLPKSIEAVIGFLGTLRARAIYVPVDTESPPARAALVLRSADCRVVLANTRTAALVGNVLPSLASPMAVGWMEASPVPAGLPCRFGQSDLSACPDTAPSVAADPDAAAHLLFTSGSTGVPKGVVVTHANVLAFVAWANRHFGATATDRQSCHSPLHFDLSTFDLFGSFAAGAEVHLVPPELNLFPRRLVGFMRERRLTQWFSVPSILAYLAQFDALAQVELPDLRRVLWCGEVIAPPVLRYWMQHLPGAAFTNLYGPTETTIASSWFDVAQPPATDEPIPIGHACSGESLLVCDASLRPVPAGAVGEIVIAGAGVTLGYWRDEQRSRTSFVASPLPEFQRAYRTGDLGRMDAAGCVHFIGRADSQIKIRGHRVDLGEVESALHAVPEIGQAVALALPDSGWGGTEIGCAYVVRPERELSPESLRQHLAARLPRYMLPTRWLRLERLPTNGSGKVDRPGLARALDGQRAARAAMEPQPTISSAPGEPRHV